MHLGTPSEPVAGAHSPPLPAIAVGRKAFSPTLWRHVKIESLSPEGDAALVSWPGMPSDKPVMVLTKELIAAE